MVEESDQISVIGIAAQSKHCGSVSESRQVSELLINNFSSLILKSIKN